MSHRVLTEKRYSAIVELRSLIFPTSRGVLFVSTTILFVPGCGNILSLYARLEKAISMFSMQGSYICVAGGVIHPGNSRAEWEIMRDYLERRGIHFMKVLTERYSVDTVGNVTFSIDKYRSEYPRFSSRDTKIVVVSQRLHALRIRRAFRAMGKQEVEILPCPYGDWKQALLGNCLYELMAWLIYGHDPLGTGFLARMLRKILPRKTPPRVEKPVT